MSEPLLDLRDIRVRFGGVAALDGVELAVERGSIHGLIGPNGAGKTTLLNVICRIVDPASGTVRFEGRDLLAMSGDRLAHLGLSRTFQNLALIEDASVLDNVLIGLHAHRPGGLADELFLVRRGFRREGEQRRSAMEALELLGLASAAEADVARLSYGQRKMVELARAWVGQPKLLLLDEPTAGLSGTEIERLQGKLLELRERHRLAMLVITHHVEFLVGMADAVSVLDLGRLIARGTPEQVRADPAVVAAYMGSEA